jgi:hypothetical protein
MVEKTRCPIRETSNGSLRIQRAQATRGEKEANQVFAEEPGILCRRAGLHTEKGTSRPALVNGGDRCTWKSGQYMTYLHHLVNKVTSEQVLR